MDQKRKMKRKVIIRYSSKIQMLFKEDPSTIMRCLAENWKKDDGTEGINEKAINDCRDCFKGIKGSLSKAKECVAQHLPAENGVKCLNSI